MIENVLISDRSLNEIKKSFGYPLIDQEASHLMTDTQLKEYIIAPALEEWYKFYPIKTIQEIVTTGGSIVETDFPENFFCIFDNRFIPLASTASAGFQTNTGNPFYTQSLVTNFGSTTGMGRGIFGTPFDYGFAQNYYQRKFLADSQQSMNKVSWFEPDYQNNKLRMYSSTSGNFNITWGLSNNDFDKAAPPMKRQELIRYCGALYSLQVGKILSLQNSGLPETINFDMLISDAKEEIEKLTLKWADETRVFVIRR